MDNNVLNVKGLGNSYNGFLRNNFSDVKLVLAAKELHHQLKLIENQLYNNYAKGGLKLDKLFK